MELWMAMQGLMTGPESPVSSAALHARERLR